MRYVRQILVTAALAMTLNACLGSERWDRVDDFVAGLHCGMSQSDITTFANGFDGVSTYVPGPSNLPGLRAKHEGTTVDLWFDDGGLRSLQVKWISAPMKLTEEPQKDLCQQPPITKPTQ